MAFLGFTAFIVGVVWLIVSAVKKKKKKIPLIVLIAGFVVFGVATTTIENDSTAAKTKEETKTKKEKEAKTTKVNNTDKKDVSKELKSTTDKITSEFDSNWDSNWKEAWANTNDSSDIQNLKSRLSTLIVKYESQKEYINSADVLNTDKQTKEYARKMKEAIDLRIQSAKDVSNQISDGDLSNLVDSVKETISQSDDALTAAIASLLDSNSYKE